MTPRRFALPGFRGEAAESFAVADPGAEAVRLADPASATRTIHWGRNYLYLARVETERGPMDVVVKQFRPATGWRSRIGWHLAGRESKAAKSWRIAGALTAAGIATPEPLLWLESDDGRAASLFVCRHLPDRIEARYLLRARNAGRERERFPAIDIAAFLGTVARLARRLHDAGFWHRDFSIGNLLVLPGQVPEEIAEIALVDLNRCRGGRPVTLSERMRDLARLALERREDREQLLAHYFGELAAPRRAWLAYEIARRSFHGRHRIKKRLRGGWSSLKSWLVPRSTHPHIPPPPPDAGPRDRIVWDALSDQPHSHAGRLGRWRARIADLPDHARSIAGLAGAAPRIRRRYRELAAARNEEPFAWPGMGVAVRPWPARPEAVAEAVAALGVSQVLVRLHPWQAEHGAEEALARELAQAGLELTFTLPQSRELVRDPGRWKAAIEELAERFSPLGQRFQIGQAINRSKWGIWSYGEYLERAATAAEILRRRRPDVELGGPAVIDFEAHATAMVVNRRHPSLRFDALASLLYVDRRGAPENRQLGYDTVDKVTLLAAIAETSRLVAGGRQWITEVNWPLAEGPHSPAGRKVAVDEATQADYLTRFYLLALGSGYVERVFWWQLVARGYGLIDPQPGGELRRRPAFCALGTLAREVPADSQSHGPLPSPAGVRLYRFLRPDGGEVIAGWSLGAPARAALPSPPESAVGRDGAAVALAGGPEVELVSGVRFFRL